ncbi:hypothetical protein D9M68_19810 [compost metagenome]
MFEELSNILKDRVSPEVGSGIAELVRALEKHNATMYKDRINQLAMNANNIDHIILADEAIAIVYGQINALLQQMHLELDVDNIQMSRLATILEALLFEKSDDDDEISRILEEGEDSVDVFCEILAVKLNTQPETFMDIIIGVPEEVIAAIEDKITKNLGTSDEAVEGLEGIVQMMNRHSALTSGTTIGMESLNASINVVGVDPMTIIEQRKAELLELIPEDLADQVLSIVILAGVAEDEFLSETMTYIEMMLHDPFAVQKAYKRTVSRIAGLRNAT